MMYPAAHLKILAGPAESAESIAESIDTLKLCPHEEFLKLCKERTGEVLCSVHEMRKEREKQLLSLNAQFFKALN